MIKWPVPLPIRFFEIIKISNFALSPDESRLVFNSNIRGQFQLWGMDLPNTYPYPLTPNGQAGLFPSFSPDGSLIGFSSDRGFFSNMNRDDSLQIYLVKSSGSEPLKITEDDGSQNEFCQISEDGKIYYSSNRGHSPYMNLYMYDLKTGEHQPLFNEDAHCHCVKIFEEEGYIHYIKHYSKTFIQSWLYDLQTGEHILLSPEDCPHVSLDVQFISRNEVIFTTNSRNRFRYVLLYNLRTGQYRNYLKENGDIHGLKISVNKKRIAYILQKGVEDYLYILDLDTEQKVKIPTQLTAIHQVEFGRRTGKLYFLGSNAISTQNIHYYDLSNGKIGALTNNNVPGKGSNTLVDPETIHYKSFDGLKIEALLFKAEKNYNGHWLIWIHGGPQSASRKNYRGMFQYFLAKGYSIFTPNFRGSSHYGSDFYQMVEGDWGEGPGLDVIKGVEWLIKKRQVDREKLFVAGGSYGGYLALLLHGCYPEFWKGIVDIFGPSNLLNFTQSIPEPWIASIKHLLSNERGRKKLLNDSPHTYLQNMTKPMLVIQGVDDPWVIKSDTDLMVQQLRGKGVRVDYYSLGEGDNFSSKNYELEVAEKVVEFLDSLIIAT